MTRAHQRVSDPLHTNDQTSSVDPASLSAECKSLGVELIGLTELVNQEGELVEWYKPHIDRIRDWIDRGDHAEMSWMESQIDKRCDPRLLLPEVRSAITLWLGHHSAVQQGVH